MTIAPQNVDRILHNNGLERICQIATAQSKNHPIIFFTIKLA